MNLYLCQCQHPAKTLENVLLIISRTHKVDSTMCNNIYLVCPFARKYINMCSHETKLWAFIPQSPHGLLSNRLEHLYDTKHLGKKMLFSLLPQLSSILTKHLPGSLLKRLNIPNSRVRVPPPAVDVTYGERKEISNAVLIKIVIQNTFLRKSEVNLKDCSHY
jgi:hypothetical protein